MGYTVVYTGIYQICCAANGKFYIGSAVNMKRRWSQHQNLLREGKHYNRHLQAAYNKYGEYSFSYKALEHCTKEQLKEREPFWIDITKAVELGFNQNAKANTLVGYKHSAESRANMSKAHLGQKVSDHCKQVAAETCKNRVWTDELRARVTAGKLGKKRPPVTPEASKNLSVAIKAAWARRKAANLLTQTLNTCNPQ